MNTDYLKPRNPLIHDDTTDTLLAIQSVVSSLHTAFNSFHTANSGILPNKLSIIGVTYILDGIFRALEHEINKNGVGGKVYE